MRPGELVSLLMKRRPYRPCTLRPVGQTIRNPFREGIGFPPLALKEECGRGRNLPLARFAQVCALPTPILRAEIWTSPLSDKHTQHKRLTTTLKKIIEKRCLNCSCKQDLVYSLQLLKVAWTNGVSNKILMTQEIVCPPFQSKRFSQNWQYGDDKKVISGE